MSEQWTQTCRFCRFFQEGECTRYPPTFISIVLDAMPGTEGISADIKFGYPPTNSSAGCGEFSSALESRETAP